MVNYSLSNCWFFLLRSSRELLKFVKEITSFFQHDSNRKLSFKRRIGSVFGFINTARLYKILGLGCFLFRDVDLIAVDDQVEGRLYRGFGSLGPSAHEHLSSELIFCKISGANEQFS